MTDSVYEDVLQGLHAASFDVNKLCLYLQNEPLTDPELCERIERAYKIAHPERVEISTNAALLHPEVSRELLDAFGGWPANVWLSCHGTEERQFEEQTGLSWAACMHNIRAFLEQWQAEKSVACCIVAHGNKKETRDFWHRQWRDWALERKPSLYVFRRPSSRAGNVPGIPKVRRKSGDWTQCARLGWVHVNWQGKLILCCMDYQHRVTFGDVCEGELEEQFDRRLVEVRAVAQDAPDEFPCHFCHGRTA